MKRLFIAFVLVAFVVSVTSNIAEASNWGDILRDVVKIEIENSKVSYGTWRLAGKIVNKDNEPLEGIDVTASMDGGRNYSTKTDSNGNYVLNIPTRQKFSLVMTGDTWRTIIDKFTRERKAGTTETWNYTMVHNFMRGKVTDINGVALQWVKLVFEEDGSASGIHEIYTDEHGNYQFTLPRSGSYY